MRLYKVGMSVFCNSFGARAGRLANSRSLQLFQNQARGRNHDLSRGEHVSYRKSKLRLLSYIIIQGDEEQAAAGQ